MLGDIISCWAHLTLFRAFTVTLLGLEYDLTQCIMYHENALIVRACVQTDHLADPLQLQPKSPGSFPVQPVSHPLRSYTHCDCHCETSCINPSHLFRFPSFFLPLPFSLPPAFPPYLHHPHYYIGFICPPRVLRHSEQGWCS